MNVNQVQAKASATSSIYFLGYISHIWRLIILLDKVQH